MLCIAHNPLVGEGFDSQREVANATPGANPGPALYQQRERHDHQNRMGRHDHQSGCGLLPLLAGCDNCYAERFAARLARNPKTAEKYKGVVDENGKWTGTVNLHMDGCLHAATVTRKPKRFFIGSMTDIFHENIPDEEIHNLFLAMITVPNDLPTYMVLTKRPHRAKAVLGDMLVACPELHRVWLGVTVCNQAEADEKIPVLL